MAASYGDGALADSRVAATLQCLELSCNSRAVCARHLNRGRELALRPNLVHRGQHPNHACGRAFVLPVVVVAAALSASAVNLRQQRSYC